MGYHRDGALLNLPPFEVEMRRRIWWQIILQDGKYAMMSGLSHSFLPAAWDTKVPSNVNDADLLPGSNEPIRPREGATEMAFCLFSYEIAKFLVQSQGMTGLDAVVMGGEMDAHKERDKEIFRKREEAVKNYRILLTDLDARLRNLEERFVDPTSGPLRRLCGAFRTSLVAKIRGMLVSMREQPEWGTEILNPKDNLFKTVIVHTEHSTENYAMAREVGFLWFAKLNCQIDVFSIMIGQLCQRVSGTLVDRAWKQVEVVYRYHEELLDTSQKTNAMLATFTLRAWRVRETYLLRRGIVPDVPHCIFKLREIVSSAETSTTDGTPPSVTAESLPPVPKGTGVAGVGDVPMTEEGFDQLLGGFIDVTALDWDAWGDMAGQGQDQFGGIGAFGGPSGSW